eukprot:9417526-Alexandrium_andersonii.AAC.1
MTPSLPSSVARRALCRRMSAPASWPRARAASGAAAAGGGSASWRPLPSRASWPTVAVALQLACGLPPHRQQHGRAGHPGRAAAGPAGARVRRPRVALADRLRPGRPSRPGAPDRLRGGGVGPGLARVRRGGPHGHRGVRH